MNNYFTKNNGGEAFKTRSNAQMTRFSERLHIEASPRARGFASTLEVVIPAAFIVSLILVAIISNVNADVMSSTNYKMQSDSVNFGGTRSTSGSYIMEDTAGEIATGNSTSTNYSMLAGYQQMQSMGISVTPAGNVTMSPSIPGLTGGTANGSTNFTVVTDDSAGYSATISASSSPALQSATSSFADYVPVAGANPDFAFVNVATASSFGFSPEGTDIYGRFKNNGSVCNAGSNTSGGCWDGLSTTPKTFVNRTISNQPTGTVSTLRFMAASGSQHNQISGVYVATTTITVMAN